MVDTEQLYGWWTKKDSVDTCRTVIIETVNYPSIYHYSLGTVKMIEFLYYELYPEMTHAVNPEFGRHVMNDLIKKGAELW